MSTPPAARVADHRNNGDDSEIDFGGIIINPSNTSFSATYKPKMLINSILQLNFNVDVKRFDIRGVKSHRVFSGSPVTRPGNPTVILSRAAVH